MDFRIRGYIRSQFSGLGAGRIGALDGRAKIRGETSELEQLPTDKVTISSRASAGSPLNDSNAKNRLDLATKAANRITSLREQQLALAEKIAATTDPEERTALSNEGKSLQEEIDEIGTTSYQGENILSSRSLTIGGRPIVQADTSQLAASSGLDFEELSTIEAALAAQQDIVSIARRATTSLSDASAKAASSQADPLQDVTLDPARQEVSLAKVEEASAVARELATQISQDLKPQDVKEAVLTDNLDAPRAEELLEE